MTEKRILIAVTASIAAYKSCELVRNLAKRGYPVQVLMTENAERFVGRVTFQALSGRDVFVSEWDTGMVHIDLKNMAAVLAIVPATANIIGKLAHGIADDVVSSTYLAATCPVLVAPAMNPGMYASPAVQRNLAQLREDGVRIIDPSEGEVVCGDIGHGKLAPLAEIEAIILEEFTKHARGEKHT